MKSPIEMLTDVVTQVSEGNTLLEMIYRNTEEMNENRRWRLLSRDGGQNWEVMSHERYSKLKDRK